MPQMPGGSDLHIDQALSNVSVAYFQDSSDFLADDIFPSVNTDKRSNLYRKYAKSDWRRSDAQKRAPGTESAGIGWNVSNDQFYCEVYAAHVDIDDQTRANADNDWQLDSDATRLVTNHLLLQKDQLWCQNFFKAGVWGTEFTGVGSNPSSSQWLQWNLSSSDPLSNFTAMNAQFRLITGKPITFAVLGVDVWSSLANHPAILDRIKYTQKGVVTLDLVKSFFGLQKMRVAWASQATGPQVPDAKAQDAAASYSFIANTKGALFGYAPSSASRLEPSAGYTFNWTGYGAGNRYGLTMGQMRMPHLKSDRIEGEAAYTQKIVAADCGIYVNSLVA